MIEPKTALGRVLIDTAETQQLLTDFELGSFECVILEGQEMLNECRRLLLVARNLAGRTTTYVIDIPLGPSAEPGARVYRDVTNG